MRRVWDLNLYKLEQHVQTYDDALEVTHGLKWTDVKNGLGFDGRLYVRFGEERVPGWADFVNPNVKTKVAFKESESVSAVLFVRTAAGLYAYTFGQGGRYLLDPDAVVPDFGKKVALSIIQPDSIRSADLQTVRALPFQSKLQAAKGVKLDAFGVDTQQDYLRAATGNVGAAHVALATRVTGADVLQFHSAITFDQLGTRADAFATAYAGGAYRSVPDFRWIDQLTIVKSSAITAQLDALLLPKVQAGDFEFGPPEVVDWGGGPTYAFAADTAPDHRVPLPGAQLLLDRIGAANLPGLTVDELRQLKLYGFYGNEPQYFGRWRAYDCIEGEVFIGAQRYLLSAGRWCAIAPQFLQDIDAYVNALSANAPAMPAALAADDVNANGNLDEGPYITRFCGVPAHQAAKIHQCGHATRVNGVEVEFCDAFTAARDLIHFKIWRCSQTFSTLAMQGANSAEFLQSDAPFRAQCRNAVAAVNPSFPPVLADGFNSADYRIVFALIRSQQGSIPFFSRLTLKRQAERVRGRGFGAAYVVIPVQ